MMSRVGERADAVLAWEVEAEWHSISIQTIQQVYGLRNQVAA